MREASPNQFCTSDLVSGSQSAAKSLFWNILAASPCGSRFCGDSEGYPVGKFFWVNILGESAKKNLEASISSYCHSEQSEEPMHFAGSTTAADKSIDPSARKSAGLRMTGLVEV